MKKLNELTIVEARRGLINSDFSVEDLATACLGQIKCTDSDIRAFITVCEKEAIDQARSMNKDLRFMNRKRREELFEKQPLFGIPIAVKDNFCTKGIRTTAGSKVLEDFVPAYDATVVKKLKDAGAIIVGKTNMDAWAHGSSTETSDFGTTKNPHDLTRSPGGSSGGSAAAVAANQVVAAIGSETAGSIRQPAAWCGVVGLKPTYGRVSRYGLIAMCSSTDCPGPITKTTEDAAIILSTIAGSDGKDATTRPKPIEKYAEELDKVDPKKITIGIPKEYFLKEMDKDVRGKILAAIERFKELGFKTKEVSLLDPKYSIAIYTIIQRAEVSSNLGRYDGIRYGNGRGSFGEEAKRRIMLGTHVLSAGYYDQYYLKGQKMRTIICDDFKRVFKTVDLLAAATSPSLALKIGESEKYPMFGEMQDVLVEASSLAGLPGININCGLVNNLPVGLQIFGPQYSEKLIIKIAHLYEKQRG